MDQELLSLKTLKCQIHQFQSLDFIDLTGCSSNGRSCIICIQKKETPHEEYLAISELFGKKKGQLLTTYPPFKSKKITSLIEYYCEEIKKDKIDSFFSQLREDIEIAIQQAENKMKQQLVKNEEAQQILLKELSKIAEIDCLKELLVSGSENLNAFLQEKWKNADGNKQNIEKLMSDIKENFLKIDFEQKQKEANSLIKSLQELTLIDESIIKRVNLDKSFVHGSGNYLTKRTNNNSLQFINITSLHQRGQGFLDFVINPKKRYSINLNYQPKLKDNSYFLFGLVPDSSKEENWAYEICKMNYYNQNEEYGISKYVKGPNITKHQRKNVKEEFEIRIYLEEKILKVASLPNYSSVIQLDHTNKIQKQTNYRFFVLLQYAGDMIEITVFRELGAFQNNFFWET